MTKDFRKEEMNMRKYKKLMMTLVICLAGVVFLAGWGMDASGDGKDTITATGTLEAVDTEAGTVKIVTARGELELKVDDKSQISLGETADSLAGLADREDIEVRVEYDMETKILKSVRLEE